MLTDARLVDAALVALRRKYGWQMIITTLFSKLFGRYRNRAYIEIKIRNPSTA